LRHLTALKLAEVHRHHLGTQLRDADREVTLHRGGLPLADSVSLAAQLLGTLATPSQAAIKAETRLLVQEALNHDVRRPWSSSATTGSSARSAGAGWASSTRPSRSRWGGMWPSRCGPRLYHQLDEALRSSPVVVWDLASGGDPEPLHLDGHVNMLVAVTFSPDGRRLATAAVRGTQDGCEVKLWDLVSGRNLVTWALPGRWPVDLAFDPEGHRLRVLLLDSNKSEARIVLFDAAPLDPEVEGIDVVDRLYTEGMLNSELATKIEAEPGLDPAVRAAALAAVPLCQESVVHLTSIASAWLGAHERTPELSRRALAHIERVRELVHDLDYRRLAILGEARYRNGLLAESLEPLRQSLAIQEHDNPPVDLRDDLSCLFLAMAEAKLGHRAAAQTALDDYRTRRAHGFAGSRSRPRDDALLAEAEAVFREAFDAPPAAVPTPVPKP
jgi:hypothetical protein